MLGRAQEILFKFSDDKQKKSKQQREMYLKEVIITREVINSAFRIKTLKSEAWCKAAWTPVKSRLGTDTATDMKAPGARAGSWEPGGRPSSQPSVQMKSLVQTPGK